MYAFADPFRESFDRHQSELVRVFADEARKAREDAEKQGEPAVVSVNSDQDFLQMIHGLKAIMVESLEGIEDGPAHRVYVETLFSSLRGAGVPLTRMVPMSSALFVHVAALCVPAVPPSEQQAARHWLASFTRRYLQDLLNAWIEPT